MSSAQTKAISESLKKLEALNRSQFDRDALHRSMDELRQEIDSVGDPVLKTEYMRKLSVLRGADVPWTK